MPNAPDNQAYTAIASMPTYTMALPDQQALTRRGFSDKILQAPGSICIVPPFRPDRVRTTQAAPPKLTYRGGPLLSSVEVATTFWGDAWTQQPQNDLGQRIGQFFGQILTSRLMDQLDEYNVDGQTIGHGKPVGAMLINMTLSGQLSDSQIRQLLQQLLSNNPGFPQPAPNRLYFMFFPPGVDVVSGNSRSCQQFCGYHSAMQGGIYYAVMPFPCQGGCTGNLSVLDALTSVTSHELCEAITDPVPGHGWYDDANGEIGDICAWQVTKIGDFAVQKQWSNRSNACL